MRDQEDSPENKMAPPHLMQWEPKKEQRGDRVWMRSQSLSPFNILQLPCVQKLIMVHSKYASSFFGKGQQAPSKAQDGEVRTTILKSSRADR